MPFPQDDLFNHWRLVAQARRRFPVDLPPLELPAQMAWLDDRPAAWASNQHVKAAASNI